MILVLSACHVVTQEELNPGEKIAPDPIFEQERTIYVLPLQYNEKDVDSNRFISVKTMIDNTIFNYLEFMESIPSDLNSAKVLNLKEILKYYQIENPDNITKEERYKYIEKTLKDNYEYWMKVTPEKKKELSVRYSIPQIQKVKSEKSEADWEKLVEENGIIVQTILGTKTIKFRIYDSLSFDNLVFIEENLPKDFLSYTTMDGIEKYLKELMQKAMSKLKNLSLTEVYIDKDKADKEDVAVYINNKLVQTSSVFLLPGNNNVFFTYKGEVIQRGVVKVGDTPSKINAKYKYLKGSQHPVEIETNPSHAALFINEQFIGYSPTKVFLPLGNQYLRASLMGYSHINYTFVIDKYQPLSKINLDFMIQNEKLQEQIKLTNELKSTSFFISIFAATLALVSYEQLLFYGERMTLDPEHLVYKKRYEQFTIATGVFGGVSLTFAITALVAQIYEYDLKDQGFGIDTDGNLGVKFDF